MRRQPFVTADNGRLLRVLFFLVKFLFSLLVFLFASPQFDFLVVPFQTVSCYGLGAVSCGIAIGCARRASPAARTDGSPLFATPSFRRFAPTDVFPFWKSPDKRPIRTRAATASCAICESTILLFCILHEVHHVDTPHFLRSRIAFSRLIRRGPTLRRAACRRCRFARAQSP